MAVAVEEAAKSDEKIQKYMSEGKAKEALFEQQQQSAKLKSYAQIDKSGMTKNLWSNAMQTESLIQAEGCSKRSMQKMSHNTYSKRRGSKKFMSHYAVKE